MLPVSCSMPCRWPGHCARNSAILCMRVPWMVVLCVGSGGHCAGAFSIFNAKPHCDRECRLIANQRHTLSDFGSIKLS